MAVFCLHFDFLSDFYSFLLFFPCFLGVNYIFGLSVCLDFFSLSDFPWKLSYTKEVIRFFVTLYSITSFICLIGSGVGFLELCPIPILWIINFIPCLTSFSTFYVNKSKRFNPAE